MTYSEGYDEYGLVVKLTGAQFRTAAALHELRECTQNFVTKRLMRNELLPSDLEYDQLGIDFWGGGRERCLFLVHIRTTPVNSFTFHFCQHWSCKITFETPSSPQQNKVFLPFIDLRMYASTTWTVFPENAGKS